MTRRRQERARILWGSAGIVLVLGVTGLLLLVRPGAGVSVGGVANPAPALPPFPERCGHGDSPQEAPSVAYTPLANASNMTYSVWCGPDVLIEGFRSGIRIAMESNGFPDPAQAFRQQASQDGVGASVQTVQGVPALEEDALNSDDPGRYGSVAFVINDLYIRIWGNGSIALPDLVAVAQTITPSFPGPPSPTETTGPSSTPIETIGP